MSEPLLAYESLVPITRDEAESAFVGGSPREVSRAILRMALTGPTGM